MTKYLILFALALFGVTVPLPGAAEDAGNHQEWNFTVALDGDPIGNHLFTLDQAMGAKKQWQIASKADFVVRIIGIPVFRYHHVADEEWSNGCLSHLIANTNHDGDITHVTASATSDVGKIIVTGDSPNDAGKQTTWGGCLMSFAYWNPRMRQQTQLLNPETGEIEAVIIKQQPDVTVTVHGQPVQAHVWRVMGSHEPVDVLYDDKDNWIGLDAKVRGGRSLSYRLP